MSGFAAHWFWSIDILDFGLSVEDWLAERMVLLLVLVVNPSIEEYWSRGQLRSRRQPRENGYIHRHAGRALI